MFLLQSKYNRQSRQAQSRGGHRLFLHSVPTRGSLLGGGFHTHPSPPFTARTHHLSLVSSYTRNGVNARSHSSIPSVTTGRAWQTSSRPNKAMAFVPLKPAHPPLVSFYPECSQTLGVSNRRTQKQAAESRCLGESVTLTEKPSPVQALPRRQRHARRHSVRWASSSACSKLTSPTPPPSQRSLP